VNSSKWSSSASYYFLRGRPQRIRTYRLPSDRYEDLERFVTQNNDVWLGWAILGRELCGLQTTSRTFNQSMERTDRKSPCLKSIPIVYRRPGRASAPRSMRTTRRGDQRGLAGYRRIGRPNRPLRHKDRERALDGQIQQGKPREDGSTLPVDLAIPLFGYQDHVCVMHGDSFDSLPKLRSG
jgi:hypothetical protein